MSASAIGHGTIKSRMKPMMIPAIPSFACGVMLTPFHSSRAGAPMPAQLLLAYRALGSTLRHSGTWEGRRDDLDAGRAGGQRAAEPLPARPAHRHAAGPAGHAGE